MAMWCLVWGLGFRALGLGVQVRGCRSSVQESSLQVLVSGFRV